MLEKTDKSILLSDIQDGRLIFKISKNALTSINNDISSGLLFGAKNFYDFVGEVESEINQLAFKYALDDTKKYKSFFIITWYYRLIILCYLILSVLYKIIYININYIIFIPIIIYYPYHYTKLYYKLNKTNSELFN